MRESVVETLASAAAPRIGAGFERAREITLSPGRLCASADAARRTVLDPDLAPVAAGRTTSLLRVHAEAR